jgi:hypothetical protein
MNINIYSKYKVTSLINTNYRSYDSDADDYWKEDNYVNNLEIDGGSLINEIVQRLNDDYVQDINITILQKGGIKIEINTFDPSNGEGDDFVYIIRRLKKESE